MTSSAGGGVAASVAAARVGATARMPLAQNHHISSRCRAAQRSVAPQPALTSCSPHQAPTPLLTPSPGVQGLPSSLGLASVRLQWVTPSSRPAAMPPRPGPGGLTPLGGAKRQKAGDGAKEGTAVGRGGTAMRRCADKAPPPQARPPSTLDERCARQRLHCDRRHALTCMTSAAPRTLLLPCAATRRGRRAAWIWPPCRR